MPAPPDGGLRERGRGARAPGPGRSALARVLGHARRHWHGRSPLAVAFWIDLVALRALVLGAQDALIGGDEPARGLPRWPVALALLAVHGALFAWQAVGTVRAAEAHARDTGSPAGKVGALLGLLVAFWLTLAWALEGYQTTSAPEQTHPVLHAERERSPEIASVGAGTALRLSGPFALGATARTRAALDAAPGTVVVTLESPGGSVPAARGLARLFRERGLRTHVEGTCASACAVAFIGGERRTLGPGARLGLHRYRLDAVGGIATVDVAAEQRRDAALYAAAGVAPAFVRRMFEARADAMWWPTPGELIDAGVAHAVETR